MLMYLLEERERESEVEKKRDGDLPHASLFPKCLQGPG